MIAGGGEGGTAREVLRYSDVEEATISFSLGHFS